MRLHVKWLLTAALAALIAAPAFSQLMPGGMMPVLENGIGPSMLLLSKDVQREIRLTDEQRYKFRRITAKVDEKYGPDMQRAAEAGDRKKQLKLFADATREKADKVNKAIPDILKPAQAKRLKQIEIQVNTLISLNKPEIQKQLNLTERQKDEMRDIGDGFKQDLAGVVKDASNSEAQRPLEKLRMLAQTARKIKDLNETARRKALGKLTDEQMRTWRELTGEKFEFQFDILGGPGPRR
jgi:hypothetical protein